MSKESKENKAAQLKDDVKLKHKFITFGRVFKAGTSDLVRSAWLSVAAIAIMVVALAVVLFTVVINITMRNAIEELSRNLKVSVYLYDDVTQEERDSLQSALGNHPITEEVEYITEEMARQRFIESFERDEDLLEGLLLVGADTLPASFDVTVNDLERMSEIEEITELGQFEEIVESVTLGRQNARDAIDSAAALQRFLITSSIVAGAVFTIISILIIFNTIRITIFTRKEEIRSMKLIGATPGYIRGPFLVGAAFYGIIASFIATGTIYALIYSLGSSLAGSSRLGLDRTYQFLTEPLTILTLFLVSLGAGIMVGVFSSDLAMRKHLKLKNW